MLFPIGINQSYSQTTNPLTNQVTIKIPEFDFASHVVIGDTCLDDAALTVTATGVTGSLGGVSSVFCFESHTRTWQAFIIKADVISDSTDDDDIIQTGMDPKRTSGDSDEHEIDFSDLVPETEYRIVLAITGAYNEDGVAPYADASVYRVAEFTTPAATAPPGTPTAPRQNIEVPIGATTLTIPFSTFVPAVSGNTFEELTITFRLGIDAKAVFNQFTSFTGTTSTPNDGNAVLTVNADTVVITTTLPTDHATDLTFTYSVANTAGVSANGVIEFNFVAPTIAVTANTHTVTLPNLLGLPRIDLPISDTVITNTLLAGSTLGAFTLADVTFTTNGTGVNSAGVVDNTITGSEGGTLTVTNPTSSSGPIFHYTPMMLGTTETFEYTATLDGVSDSSTLSIVTPALACEGTNSAGIAFGELANGQTSVGSSTITATNTGNTANQPMIKGDDWKSTTGSNPTIMLANQTKYDTTDTAFDVRTSITSGNANLGGPLGIDDGTGSSDADNSVSAFIQVLLKLIDPAFRGGAEQVVTITVANCNE